MKTLRDYIAESQAWAEKPQAGDAFAIELAPDHLIESYVVESADDGIVIGCDEQMFSLLESHGLTTERIARYGAVGSNRGMGFSVAESNMSELDIEYQDYKKLMPAAFVSRYKMTKDEWYNKYKNILPKEESSTDDNFSRMLELAGCGYMEEDQGAGQTAMKAAALAPVGAMGSEIDEGADEVTSALRKIANSGDDGYDMIYDGLMGRLGKEVEMFLQNMYDDITIDHHLHPDDDFERIHEIMMDRIEADYGDEIDEAKYHGREVPLNKPMQGDVKKSKVYVKDPRTGNIKKVNFGDPNMRIKKSSPAHRRSFRARHNCENPGPKTSARYWSCRAW